MTIGALPGLVLTYEDLLLGTTYATVVALCDRLGLSEIATLDRRHFTAARRGAHAASGVTRPATGAGDCRR
jgi:hypothetical protein